MVPTELSSAGKQFFNVGGRCSTVYSRDHGDGAGGQPQLTPRQGHQGHGPLKLEFLNSFDLQNPLESFKRTDS